MKVWALLFDPELCNEKYKGKTTEQMVMKEAKLDGHAIKINQLREQLRARAADLA